MFWKIWIKSRDCERPYWVGQNIMFFLQILFDCSPQKQGRLKVYVGIAPGAAFITFCCACFITHVLQSWWMTLFPSFSNVTTSVGPVLIRQFAPPVLRANLFWNKHSGLLQMFSISRLLIFAPVVLTHPCTDDIYKVNFPHMYKVLKIYILKIYVKEIYMDDFPSLTFLYLETMLEMA